MISLQLAFITPLFSKGSYDDQPEIRPPSIRGQLHWWFRALGGKPTDENAIFGSVHANPVQASKVVVRVNNVAGQSTEIATLPHKQGGQASPKFAFKQGATCHLHFSQRLGGLDDRLGRAFDRTLESWLLLGTLGLRATRAGGSFSWNALTDTAPQMPRSTDGWRARCHDLLRDAPLRFHIANEDFSTAEEARRVVSDTIGGRDDREGGDSLARINHPLGRVFGGRKTSPLRFRIIPIANRFHIAAVWDDRTAVTGNRTSDLAALVEMLNARRKSIGSLLRGMI